MRSALLAFLLLSFGCLHAQAPAKPAPKLVQFSGVAVTGDSLEPVSFVSVMAKNSYRGTIGDIYGYFSFVAQAGDTLLFNAIGFRPSNFIVPIDLEESRYSMIHVLYVDTMTLEGINVRPWPTKEQFADAFLNLRLPADDGQIAMRNLSPAQMLQQLENMPPDAAASYNYTMALDNTRLYSQGGYPTTNLFNPVAWAQFIQAWKSGAYKKKP